MKRKLIFSLMFIFICFTTMVVTTYAWVGILSNSTFEKFTMNLSVDNDGGDYGIQISLSGREGTFHDSIEKVDLERQILKNLNYNVDSLSNNSVERIFEQSLTFDQCTPKLIEKDMMGNTFPLFSTGLVQPFESITRGEKTNKFIYFDLYLILYNTVGSDDSDNALNVYLRNELITSEVCSQYLANDFIYPTNAYYDGIQILNRTNGLPTGHILNDKISVNAANACRVAFQKFEAVDKYDVTTQPSTIDSVIYQSGSTFPTYDSSTKTYDFGGILPKEYNIAYHEYTNMYGNDALGEIPDWQYPWNRGDKTFSDNGVDNHLVKLEDNVSTKKMIKFRVYFWVEGWDSNCFSIIDKQPIKLTMSFSNKSPNDAD